MRISEYNFHDFGNIARTELKRNQQSHGMALAEEQNASGRPLDVTDFAAVVAATPLISIDLIVRDQAGNSLFGLRENPPAQGMWFVPGGRIYKSESLDTAFRRIVHSELRIDMERSQSRLLGVFEHFYDINFLNEPGMSTHYIVMAHVITMDSRLVNPPRQQHSDYIWLHDGEIEQRLDIHPYAKAYFRNE